MENSIGNKKNVVGKWDNFSSLPNELMGSRNNYLMNHDEYHGNLGLDGRANELDGRANDLDGHANDLGGRAITLDGRANDLGGRANDEYVDIDWYSVAIGYDSFLIYN